MMLPILISVSVTPVSYFFCATADTVVRAMISAESPGALMSARTKFVVKKSLSARLMSFLPPVRANLTASVGQFPRPVFFGTARRIAAAPGYRKQRPARRIAIARDHLSREGRATAAQQER